MDKQQPDDFQNALQIAEAATKGPLKPKAFKMPRAKAKRMTKKVSQQMGRKRTKSIPGVAVRSGQRSKTAKRKK